MQRSSSPDTTHGRTSSPSLHNSPVRPESMSTQISTAPPSVDESNFLAIANAYPSKANLNHYPDQRSLVLWLACCAGKEVLRALFYRPSTPETVVVEVNREVDRFHDLLGQHVWSEFLIKPTKEQMGKSSTVFYSTFTTGRLVRGGWTRVKIEERWFQGWSVESADNPKPYNHPFIKCPYPKSSHCNGPSSSEGKSGEPVCSLLPQQPFAWPLPPSGPSVDSAELPASAARNSNADPPFSSASTKNGKTAAPSDIVSVPVPCANSKSTKSFSPPSARSPAPSSVVANHHTKNDARKLGPPYVSSRPSASASRAPSTIGSLITRPSRGAPPSFPGLGRRLSSPSRTSERFDWSQGVERLELKQITSPPVRTPAPSHSCCLERRQLKNPLGSIEPSRVYDYNEEDEPRHSTEAALTDLFDDGFFIEASSVKSGGGGTRALGPDDPDYDPWNPPADAPENLWEGYDTPRLELPTKVKKNGEWTCPQHGSLCSPGICKERGCFERDERMRNNREKWEEERIERETPRKRGRPKKGTRAPITGEWRSSPPHLRGNSSSTTTATTTATTNSDSSSDNDTPLNQGYTSLPPLDEDDSSIDGFRLNGGSADTQSTVSSAGPALGSIAGSDDGKNDEVASVPRSRATHTRSAISRNSRAAPPASVSSSRRNKGPTTPPPTPSVKAPAQVSPTSPRPASNARSSANQSPSLGRHSVSAPSVSVAPSNNATSQRSGTGSATRKSASETRTSSVSSKAWTPLPAYADPIANWLAGVRAETAKQKVSKGARKRRNKVKTARAQAQEQEQVALATVLEAEIEVEPPFEGLGNEWGNPNVVW